MRMTVSSECSRGAPLRPAPRARIARAYLWQMSSDGATVTS